ncbi:MAG: acetamidase/formamidase family protein, partial [Thermoplasmataceae archaeon]
MKFLDGKKPENIHFKWSADLEPVISMKSGDQISILVPDSSTWQIKREFSTIDLANSVDPEKYDGAVGPILVEDARPGDTLEVSIHKIRTGNWGWSAIIPEIGFLKGLFDNRLVVWDIGEDAISVTKDFLAGIRIPVHPFLGVMGTAPSSGSVGMIPPQRFGGNMDNKKLGIG